MKSIAAAALLVAVVSAQAGLPACAITCATGSFSASGCESITNYSCLCASSAYLQAYANCVASTCSAADAQTASTIGTQLCASAGVTITSTPTASTASNSAASSSAISSASSAASSVSSSLSSRSSESASSASSAASSMSSASSHSASSASSASTHSASSAASASSASASSAASSASSHAAAPTHALAWEVLGLGAAAAAVLL